MVEYVVIKGEKLPVRISYYALKHVQEDLKREMDLSTPEGWDFEVLECLLFYGLKRGHEMENKPFSFKKEDMENALDLCFTEFLDIIPKSFGVPEKPLPVSNANRSVRRSTEGKKESAAGQK
jgi:hypothetical protein